MPFKAVVIGSGAREHALVRALLRGARSGGEPREVVAIPGNAGIGEEARCVPAAGQEDYRVSRAAPIEHFELHALFYSYEPHSMG